MIIGITGSIATGKTTVTNYLASKGFKVIDLDEIAHHILDSEVVINKLLESFPKEIFIEGKVNRKVLGELIFSSNDYRKSLNDITHPLIIEEMFKEINNSSKSLIFVDVPLLYETSLESKFDKVIVVNTPKDLQINRLMERNNLTLEEALMRINAQMPIIEKVNKADYVVDNSKDISNTFLSVDKILKEIINKEK